MKIQGTVMKRKGLARKEVLSTEGEASAGAGAIPLHIEYDEQFVQLRVRSDSLRRVTPTVTDQRHRSKDAKSATQRALNSLAPIRLSLTFRREMPAMVPLWSR